MQVIGIVGYKNSGKTTLITRLIAALGARGLSVSTLKHIHHAIDLDQPGKDTYAHREAGAVDVMMVSDKRWALLHERRGVEAEGRLDLSNLLRRLSPVDIVLVEGFKSLPMTRIEIRSAADPAPVTLDGHTIGIVSDGPAAAGALPAFHRDDIDAIAAFIADRVRPPR